METLRDQMIAAKEMIENNPNNFVWKGEKVKDGDKFVQEEVPLVSATQEQLQKFRNHCITMLTNDSKTKPGRYLMLDIINDQKDRCGVQLFLKAKEAEGIAKYTIIDSIRKSIDENGFTQKDTEKLLLSDLIMVNSEYYKLPINLVVDGCLDRLGRFNRDHITLAFILSQGIWFTDEELVKIREIEDNYKSLGVEKNIKDIVREYLKIPYDAKVIFNPKGLSLAKIEAILKLKSKKYSELTTIQLKTLRENILFSLEDTVNHHINQWKSRIEQIDRVAELRNIKLK